MRGARKRAATKSSAYVRKTTAGQAKTQRNKKNEKKSSFAKATEDLRKEKRKKGEKRTVRGEETEKSLVEYRDLRNGFRPCEWLNWWNWFN